MVKVTKLGRGSELGSKLRPSDSNPEWLRQEIGRTAPPDLLLCPGLSSDKELSGEEEPGTRKICKGVENRKWRAPAGIFPAPGSGSTRNPAERQAGPGSLAFRRHPATVPGSERALSSHTPCFPGSSPSKQETDGSQVSRVQRDPASTGAGGLGEPQRRDHV